MPLEGTAVGLVPTDGRGSLPFALLHGEPLVAVASWALQEAGVELLDFTADWADVVARNAHLVVHDPLCPGTPAVFLREALDRAVGQDSVVVGVSPVTDTVRVAREGGLLGDVVDRAGLVQVCSPVVLPARVLSGLPALPSTDLVELVCRVRDVHPVLQMQAPASAHRVVDDSDVRLLEELAPQPPAG
jgi:2-C-methyl-D-erythritol 4-phosphate cytidylyltransferase